MTNHKEREGIILIPDFSGFTEFVFATKIHTGGYIIKQLLLTLIEANKKHFYISEIEGDAILFYKYSKTPCFDSVMEVLKRMLYSFNQKLVELELALDTTINMSLKFIVHHGDFSRYTIKYFNKLYGKPVIEAHKLLKNDYTEKGSYIFLTDSFLYASKSPKLFTLSNTLNIPKVGVIYYPTFEELLSTKLEKTTQAIDSEK